MEKLIKLLNEYLKKEDKSIYTFYWNQVFNCIHRGNGERCDKEWICSKSFGFIKWLVENNKIDREQKTKEFRLQIELDNGSYGELGGEARLLMLLSISDTPIEDLISYLR